MSADGAGSGRCREPAEKMVRVIGFEPTACLPNLHLVVRITSNQIGYAHRPRADVTRNDQNVVPVTGGGHDLVTLNLRYVVPRTDGFRLS